MRIGERVKYLGLPYKTFVGVYRPHFDGLSPGIYVIESVRTGADDCVKAIKLVSGPSFSIEFFTGKERFPKIFLTPEELFNERLEKLIK